MKTDEEKGRYDVGNKAAIIERPRTIHAIGDKGLEEYQVFGWVKMSAKFCAHIKKLRGAKLAIWLCIALNIDENGECNLTIKDFCALTDYSHTEVISSVKELDEMNFLSVNRDGKRNIYRPIFVAKGKGNSPETLVKKVDSTPVDSVESTPSEGNSSPTSIKKEQEYGADAPNERVWKIGDEELPVDWQVGLGKPLTTLTEDELFKKQARDSANLIEQGCAGGGELAYAFMVTRQIILPEIKAKGQRKAAKEMIEAKVKVAHVIEATKQLMSSKDRNGRNLTVVDLFSVQNTAIGIANQPVIGDPNYVRPEHKPVQEKQGNFVPPPANLRKPGSVPG